MRIGQAARVVVVLVCVVFAAASATAPAGNNSPTPKGEQPIEHPGRGAETIETETAVDGIEIAVAPYRAAGWRIGVKNNTESLVRVIWDESTFVAGNGQSAGRLIRGETKRIDMAKEQPPTPIPAHAATREIGFAEKLYSAEEIESEYAEKAAWNFVNRGGVPSRLNEQIVAHRKTIKAALDGGALNITIQIGEEKKAWVGRVSAGGKRAGSASE